MASFLSIWCVLECVVQNNFKYWETRGNVDTSITLEKRHFYILKMYVSHGYLLDYLVYVDLSRTREIKYYYYISVRHNPKRNIIFQNEIVYFISCYYATSGKMADENNVVQNQQAVTAHFSSKQLLPSGFARQNRS